MEFPLYIRHEVPFSLEEDQVLYLDPIGGEHLSEDSFNFLREKYAARGLTLLTLRSIIDSLPGELFEYYLPEIGDEHIPTVTVMAEKLAGEMLFELDRPQALRYDSGIWFIGYGAEGDETPKDFLEGYLDEVHGEKSSPGRMILSDCCEERRIYEEEGERRRFYEEKRERIRFNKEEKGVRTCAELFPTYGSAESRDEEYDINLLLEELSEANEDKLRSLGLSEQALRFLLGYANPKYSRVSIKRNAAIILEDYGGREIKLDDKTKALYFLFLRHTEGLSIKDLPQHTEELLDLYQSISGRDDPAAMRKTIENLCDPFQNNANISLSRIKKAFCEAFTPLLAKQYYVDGERGGLRSIAIERSLVNWETIR